jgi:hypothetical protein
MCEALQELSELSLDLQERNIDLSHGFLTWGTRTPWGSVDRFQGVRELGWENNYIFIFTNL